MLVPIRVTCVRFTRLLLCGLVCWWVLSSGSATVAQSHDSSKETRVPGNADSAQAANAPTPAQREQIATIAMTMFAGILCGAIFLLALILIWGRRLRRLARASTPKPTAVNETWYLKPDKEDSAARSDDSDDIPPRQSETDSA